MKVAVHPMKGKAAILECQYSKADPEQ